MAGPQRGSGPRLRQKAKMEDELVESLLSGTAQPDAFAKQARARHETSPPRAMQRTPSRSFLLWPAAGGLR